MGEVIKRSPDHHEKFLQPVLLNMYQLFSTTFENDEWYTETTTVPPTSHDKFVITARKQVRLPRLYVQNKSEAEMEMKGVSDCKKTPTQSPHHVQTFLGICCHGIAQIAIPMSYSESPRFLLYALLQYWETPPPIVYYDNSCHALEYALNREPDFIKDTLFLVDRFHYPNHSSCSRTFDSRRNPCTLHLNSQVCEQYNRLLKKVGTSIQYSNADSFKAFLTAFMCRRNQKVLSALNI